MGCASSTSAHEPDAEGQEEDFCGRLRIDKRTGEVIEGEIDDNDPEDGMFEAMDAGEGEQFMAVRPYKGAIMEPDNHPEPNPEAPDENFSLEYCYGYRCEDSRQNVYFNSEGKIVYMTAALGVILDSDSNTQTFFGGGQADHASKHTSSTENCHNNDITAIAISQDRSFAATGQVGKSPVGFTWDASSGEKKARFQVNRGGRGVAAIAISHCGNYVALVDRSNDHNVYVFDANSGALQFSDKGDANNIYDICFSQREGCTLFGTSGAKHIKFWNADGSIKGKKGIHGNTSMTSHACIAWDDQGNAYTGATNSLIYVWSGDSRQAQSTIEGHGRGFICSIIWRAGKLYSGGKDGQVLITDTASKSVEKTITFGNLIRAIDVHNDQMVVGLRKGDIVKCDASGENQRVVMSSHSDGEIWGLDLTGSTVVTSADDNKVKVYDTSKRECIASGKISDEVRKVKCGASSLSRMPASKCARAVAINKANGHIAIGCNDGTFQVRNSIEDIDNVIYSDRNSRQWIEAISYSPDGGKVAVGSHDNKIRVYDANNGYALLGTCSQHNSFIVSVDWSLDGTQLRSVCGAHELLFFNAEDCSQNKNGASANKGTEWATNTTRYSWSHEGIIPKGQDGTHINGVNWSNDKSLIVTGDDWGLVNVFRNPCRVGHKPKTLRGHSEHVVRVKFNEDDSVLFSIGGYDQTLMQWRKN